MARRPSTSPQGASLPELILQSIPPLHPAGRPFVVAGLALAGVGLRSRWARDLGLGLALASAAFFRHPDRVPPEAADAVVAAADGQICLVDEAVPPPELEWTDTALPRVATFLSLFDVHVQRAPLAGTVVRQSWRPGRFQAANQEAAGDSNERNSVVFRGSSGSEVAAVQIAGLVARRIVCQVAVGDEVAIGQTWGLIRFGSRVDLYLPPGATPLVAVGQRSVGGETILARLP
ncbi:MAG: phosphatidylserine decarboxylase [Propionibacteriaceae bacterium]|jgi:phosphatidylserine decarboxylase|nr:phosphatidylserine decarboxylase [Propionibacteriaceae bacterium]